MVYQERDAEGHFDDSLTTFVRSGSFASFRRYENGFA
jgi:hypothetical protein